MKKTSYVIGLSLSLALPLMVQAAAPVATTLLEAPGARAASLGEAFTAAEDDVTAALYNPALLRTLERSQVSFSYNKGIADDSFSHFSAGIPTENWSFGVFASRYDSGRQDIFDGTTERNVTLESDLIAGVSAARMMGRVSLGVNAKYFSTSLGESTNAHGAAADLGLSFPISQGVRVGAALRNLGSKLSLDGEQYDLPRIADAGLSVHLNPNRVPTTLFFDAPYSVSDKKINPAAGLEVRVGLLALRAGYKSGGDLEGFSTGAGVAFKNVSIDYALGLVNKFDARQRVSLAMRFGGSKI